MGNPFWTESIALWVSRKDADGRVYKFSVSGWVFMLLGTFAVFNALLWGGYGLYEFGKLVF